MTALRVSAVAAVLALLAAFAAASDPLFVSLHPLAQNFTMGFRHCSYDPYASPVEVNEDFIWQLVSPLDGSTNSAKFSLRSVGYNTRYICYVNASVYSGQLMAVVPPANKSLCVFEKVAPLATYSTVSLFSIKQGDMYIALSGTLIGGCSSYWSSPASSVVLTASPPSAEGATWLMNDVSKMKIYSDKTTTLGIRHCSYYAYGYAPDSSDDFKWVFVKALDNSSLPDYVSIHSSNYPTYYLGPYSYANNTRIGAVSYCSSSDKAACVWKIMPSTSSTGGSFSLYHPYSGQYLALDTSVTGSCTWNSADIVLANSSTLSTTALSWHVLPTGEWPGYLNFSVTSASPLKNLSADLWGVFFEEINFAGEGGLYAELVRNRDFEALGRGILGTKKGNSTAIAGDIAPWTYSTSGTVTVALQSAEYPYVNNPNALSMVATTAATVQLSNPGFWGISCENGKAYHGSIYVKSTAGTTIRLQLGTSSSTAVVNVTGTAWQKYNFTVTGTETESNTSLVVSVTLVAGQTMYLDHISLFPGDAVAGLFRKDLFDLVAALKPSFLRFPGGNYLEGYTMANRWAWKTTIGEVANRSGHMNDAWNYWTNDGLGLYEYHVLCEKLGAKPLMSIFTGYFLSVEYTNISECGPFAEDAVDAIEYANGEANTTWGAMRAAAGHPASFNMTMVEVGNEEGLPAEYATHYELITSAIWALYPNFTVIASGRWGASMTGHPCINGQHCDLWDDHNYLTPADAASRFTYYDSYTTSTPTYPKVFQGEYAANSGGAAETVEAAVGESSLMAGFERNGDVVRLACFAPLFRHVSGTQWSYDLINYNSSNVYVLPSYFIQQMYSVERCVYTVPSTYSSSLRGVACVQADGDLIIKIINYDITSLAMVKVAVNGFPGYRTDEATVTMLTGASLVNTLAAPNTVKLNVTTVDLANDIMIPTTTWMMIKIQPNTTSAESSSSTTEEPAVLSSSSSVKVQPSEQAESSVAKSSSAAVAESSISTPASHVSSSESSTETISAAPHSFVGSVISAIIVALCAVVA